MFRWILPVLALALLSFALNLAGLWAPGGGVGGAGVALAMILALLGVIGGSDRAG